MDNKLKIGIRQMMISVMIYFALPISCVSAGIIKQDNSSDGIPTYYVSTHEENMLVFNYINAKMETEAKVIYSGEMVRTAYDYLQEALRYQYLPQNQILNVSNGVSSYYSYSMSKKENSNGTVTVNYHVQYLESEEQTEYVQNRIRSAIKENISNLKTDYEKALWAYQWIIDHVHYDDTVTHFSAYDGFQSSGTVCSGYASLYCFIANELGLNCNFVSGTVGLEEKTNHAWNIVKLNNEWYCADATMGDAPDSRDTYILTSMSTISSYDMESGFQAEFTLASANYSGK
jgi:transglutaminase/protease-like cytokinesis protein 3